MGRGRERVGSTVVGREAVLERRPGEVGRATRSTAEGRLRRKHAAHPEGEQKRVLLTTEPSLGRYPSREGEVVLPFPSVCSVVYVDH